MTLHEVYHFLRSLSRPSKIVFENSMFYFFLVCSFQHTLGSLFSVLNLWCFTCFSPCFAKTCILSIRYGFRTLLKTMQWQIFIKILIHFILKDTCLVGMVIFFYIYYSLICMFNNQSTDSAFTIHSRIPKRRLLVSNMMWSI